MKFKPENLTQLLQTIILALAVAATAWLMSNRLSQLQATKLKHTAVQLCFDSAKKTWSADGQSGTDIDNSWYQKCLEDKQINN